jgi:predicted AlkP superfamily phosphohydrolase/phosphomutase
MTKAIVLGIDSLDPHVLSKYAAVLPNFARLMQQSPTFLSESVFPVDTIPAWQSIYTGLRPGNHGLLYVYDVFDPMFTGLEKVSIDHVKGKTFWDHLGRGGYRNVILFPQLMYPAWEVNGVMVSKSPLERTQDWLTTEVDVSACPEAVMKKYDIPHKHVSLWGGFPDDNRLGDWVELGKEVLEREKRMGLSLCRKENFDLFFMYFNLLDPIQHRLWRFFDQRDPTYPGVTAFATTVLDYYKTFDDLVGDFIKAQPDASMLVLSDHGHQSRPARTVNINEFLRKGGYITSVGRRKKALSVVRKGILDVSDKLNLEQFLIRLVARNERLSKASKSVYSSAGSINRTKSRAFLSNFAGIKSYPHGGIEINRDGMTEEGYDKLRSELITTLSELRTPDSLPLMKWIKRREDLDSGKFCERIYPDILFEMREGYGVGWELFARPYGRAYDHKVASGGHGKDAVFLLRNVHKEVRDEVRDRAFSITNVAPSILDLFEIDWNALHLDGVSIFEQ